MTNEELAIQIQLGHSEHYTQLWEQTKKLMYKILYSKASKIQLPNYIAVEDLEQSLYFALCNAVQVFDDTKPYKFTSYLEYHIMNAIRDTLPTKSKSKMKECSYNVCVGLEEDTELIDLIPDSNEVMPLYNIELTDLQRNVRQAVAELPIKERQAVIQHYLCGLTYQQIAVKCNYSVSNAQEHTRKGIRILRRNKLIKALYDEFTAHYEHLEMWECLAMSSWEYSKEHRELQQSIELRRANGEYISYGAEQTAITLAKQKYVAEQSKANRELQKMCGNK